MEQSNNNMFSQVPVMKQEKFAELVGISAGVVEGWCNRGYVPTKLIGKHKLINMAQLTQECIDELQN